MSTSCVAWGPSLPSLSLTHGVGLTPSHCQSYNSGTFLADRLLTGKGSLSLLLEGRTWVYASETGLSDTVSIVRIRKLRPRELSPVGAPTVSSRAAVQGWAFSLHSSTSGDPPALAPEIQGLGPCPVFTCSLQATAVVNKTFSI